MLIGCYFVSHVMAYMSEKSQPYKLKVVCYVRLAIIGLMSSYFII